MPFVGLQREREIENGALLTKVGDLCNVVYRPMVSDYFANPSWTTCHIIKKNVKTKQHYRAIFEKYPIADDIFEDDKDTAIDLAWDVFCALYVIPHEQYKRNTNGDVWL